MEMCLDCHGHVVIPLRRIPIVCTKCRHFRYLDVIRVLSIVLQLQQRSRLAVGSIFNLTTDENNLEAVFAMDRDDVYDAAVDWLFTEGTDLDGMDDATLALTDNRVFPFSRAASEVEPAVMETPDTSNVTVMMMAEQGNLPQPSAATKRTQSSFDKYCCICFLVCVSNIL